jgi:hypothetical protein
VRNARRAEAPPPLALAFIGMAGVLPSDGNHPEPAESADRARSLTDRLRAIEPASWPADLVADYLEAERASRGRVPIRRDLQRMHRGPYLLNERAMYGRDGDGSEVAFRNLLVCEACGVIFHARNRRPLTEDFVRCSDCRDEKRAAQASYRRRAARAWWQDVGTRGGLEPCVGCVVLPDRNPQTSADRIGLPRCVPALVEAGNLYCSDRCRKRVARYLGAGGTVEVERGGVALRLQAVG